jgi:hypothetical protein
VEPPVEFLSALVDVVFRELLKLHRQVPLFQELAFGYMVVRTQRPALQNDLRVHLISFVANFLAFQVLNPSS